MKKFFNNTWVRIKRFGIYFRHFLANKFVTDDAVALARVAKDDFEFFKIERNWKKEMERQKKLHQERLEKNKKELI